MVTIDRAGNLPEDASGNTVASFAFEAAHVSGHLYRHDVPIAPPKEPVTVIGMQTGAVDGQVRRPAGEAGAGEASADSPGTDGSDRGCGFGAGG